MPIAMTATRRITARRKRASGFSVRDRSIARARLAPSAGAFEAGLGHLAQVEELVQRGVADAFGARELTDGATRAHRLFGELGRLVIPDRGVEGSREHRAALDQLRAALGRLKPLDASLREVAR